MKIAIVSTSANDGGAARAANRLHHGLLKIGCESFMYVRQGSSEGVVSFLSDISLMAKVKRKARSKFFDLSFSRYAKSRPSGLEIFTDDRSPFGSSSIVNIPDCDVVNLHWVAGFIDYSALPKLARIPMVWTLHDMNPFTGGCHYDNGCDKYLMDCGACPQLGSSDRTDLSSNIWHRKQAAFNKFNPEKFRVVAPSKWLAKEAKRSALFSRFDVSVIPYGLDLNFFAPRNSSDLRQAFDIPTNAQVILFLADSVQNKRKGFQFLLDAIDSLGVTSQLVFVSVGSGTFEMPVSVRHIHIGRVEDDRLLSMIYSLADVFVVPSIQDNLPNTVLESMACGTPVVGFDIGGIPDMVKNGQTGFVVPAGDVIGLKVAIEKVLGDTELRNSMSHQCRDVAVREYDLNEQASRYSNLYNQICC